MDKNYNKNEWIYVADYWTHLLSIYQFANNNSLYVRINIKYLFSKNCTEHFRSGLNRTVPLKTQQIYAAFNKLMANTTKNEKREPGRWELLNLLLIECQSH